jgi:hypothetical protein
MLSAVNFFWPVNVFIGRYSSVYEKCVANKLGNSAVDCSI